MVTGIKDTKEWIQRRYTLKSPVFLITKDDDWIGGYLYEEPTELKCVILDWKENEPVEINYSHIRVKKDFEGDFSKLPIPYYLKTKIELQGVNSPDAYSLNKEVKNESTEH